MWPGRGRTRDRDRPPAMFPTILDRPTFRGNGKSPLIHFFQIPFIYLRWAHKCSLSTIRKLRNSRPIFLPTSQHSIAWKLTSIECTPFSHIEGKVRLSNFQFVSFLNSKQPFLNSLGWVCFQIQYGPLYLSISLRAHFRGTVHYQGWQFAHSAR